MQQKRQPTQIRKQIKGEQKQLKRHLMVLAMQPRQLKIKLQHPRRPLKMQQIVLKRSLRLKQKKQKRQQKQPMKPPLPLKKQMLQQRMHQKKLMRKNVKYEGHMLFLPGHLNTFHQALPDRQIRSMCYYCLENIYSRSNYFIFNFYTVQTRKYLRRS